jgi:uncharacterized membrane protein YccC
VTALDWILSIIGIAGFATFLVIVASFVPEPALITVIVVTIAMAAFDFWARPLLRRR